MAHLIYRIYNKQAFEWDRVIRDRTNPLDMYIDDELIDMFRFCWRDMLELTEELSPDSLFVLDYNSALSPTLQQLTALHFYATGAF